MAPALLYFVSITLFGFVILAAAQLPSGLWLVLSLFAVFTALVLGSMMWIVAASEFSLPVSVGSLVLPVVAAVAVRRVSERTLFIAICVTGLLGLICARFALAVADFG